MKRFLLIFGLLTHVVRADLENLFDTEASLIVEGVHVLTGQYLHRQTYLNLPGPEPIAIQHSFQPGWDAQLGGWSPFPQSRLEIVRYGSASGNIRLFCADSRGHMHVWQQDRGIWRPQLSDSAMLPPEPGAARFDPQREIIEWKVESDHKVLTQRLAHGGDRVYHLQEHRKARAWERPLSSQSTPHEYWLYLCQEEALPSGNRLKFEYDHNGHLNRLEVVNRLGQTITEMQCQQKEVGKNDLELKLSTSDQRHVTFRLHDFRGVVAGRPQADLMLPLRVSGDEVIPQEWSYRAELKPWTSRFFGSGDLYDISGIQTIRLPEGREMHFEFDAEQRVASLQRSSHQPGLLETVYQFEYGEAGGDLWTKVIAADGGVRLYQFNARRLPKTLTWFNAEGAVVRSLRWEWSKSRPARMLMKQLCDAQAEPISTVRYAYDRKGRLAEQRRYGCFTLDIAPNNEALESSAEHVYRVRKALESALTASKRPAQRVQTTRWEYNERNLVIKQAQSDGATLAFDYWPATDRIRSELALLEDRIVRRAFFQYDEAGQLIQEIRDDGNSPQEDNCTGARMRLRITRTLGKHLPGLGLPTRLEEWSGLPGQEQLKRITTTRYGLGERPTLQCVEDPLTGQKTEQSWVYHRGRLAAHRDVVGAERRYRYDNNGNCIDQVGPATGEWVKTDFDARNRLVRRSYSDGRQVLQESWEYDPLDQVIQHILPWGAQEKILYDTLGRPHTHFLPNPHTGQPATSPSIKREFDAQDAVVRESIWDGSRWETTEWLRGVDGVPLVCRHPSGSLEGWSYNLQLHPIWTRSPQGLEIITQFDGLGHPLRQTSVLGSTTHSWSGDLLLASEDACGEETVYVHDGAGRVVQSWRGGVPTHRAYDAWDRLVWEQTGDETQRYQYDGLGRLLRRSAGPLKEPHAVITWAYGPVGDWIEQRIGLVNPSITRRSFDLAGRVTTVQDGLGSQTRSEWQLSPDAHHAWACTERLADGRVMQSFYDHRQQLSSVICSKNGQMLWKELHQTDEVGRETSVSLEEGLQHLMTRCSKWHPGGQPQRVEEYPSGRATEWQYDDEGRLKRLCRSSGKYLEFEYDLAGRLVHRYSSDGSLDDTLYYDPLSRVIKATSLLGRQTREWDARGMLIAEEVPGVGRWDMSYNASNRLTGWRGVAAEQRWCWQKGLPIKAELHSSAGIEQVELSHHDEHGHPLVWNGTHQTQFQLDGVMRPSRVVGPLFEQVITAMRSDGAWLQGTWKKDGREIPCAWSYDPSGHLVQEQGVANRSFEVNGLHARTVCEGQPVILQDHMLPSSQGNLALEWDEEGRCSTMCRQGTPWHLEWDALDRLTRAQSDLCTITYAYDVFGRLIQRKEQASGQKERIDLFHYRDLSMCAVTSSTGWWARCCLPSEGSETGTTLLLHSAQGQHVVQGDLQGNLHQATTTPYNAWGESDSPSAPWGVRGKWQDPTLGSVWMGKRWLQPELSCFLSRDPLGAPDGLSSHAYLRHQPLGVFDPWGCELQVHSMEHFQLPPFSQFIRDCRGWIGHYSRMSIGRNSDMLTIGHAVEGVAGWLENSFCPSHYVLMKNSSVEGEQAVIHVLATGICTSLDEARHYADLISTTSGGHAVYCAWRADTGLGCNLAGILLDKLLDGSERLNDCRELAQHLVEQYGHQKIRPIVSVIGFSAGARSAEVFTQTMRELGWGEQIVALGLAGASRIPGDGLLEAHNIWHRRDPIPAVACAFQSKGVTFVGEGGFPNLGCHAFLGMEYKGAMAEHIQRVHAATAKNSL